MLFEVNLPSLSPTMEEGKIVKWIKKEKDQVLSGEVLFEVETDKATMEYESPEDGYIAKILISEGSTANVNQLVAIISDDLDFTEKDLNSFSKKEIVSNDELPINLEDQLSSKTNNAKQNLQITPLALRYASKNNINLDSISSL